MNKLRSSDFEKSLRRGVKAEIRKSPALKAEYRRVRKSTRQRSVGYVGLLVIGLILPGVAYGVSIATHHLQTGLALVNLWVLALSLLQVNTLVATVYRSPDTFALFFLPVPESFIFAHNFRSFIIKSICWLFPPVLIGYITLAIWAQTPSGIIIAIIASLLSWFTMLSLTLLFVARLPWLPYNLFTGAIIFFPMILVFTQHLIGPLVLHVLDSNAQTLNLLLPSGWAPSVFYVAGKQTVDLTWGLLIPTTAIIFTSKSSIAILRRNFVFTEQVQPEPADILPAENQTPALAANSVPADRPIGPTAIEEIISSGTFLKRAETPAGFIEKMYWAWLSDREQQLTEFVYPFGMPITKKWLSVFRNLGICAVLVIILHALQTRLAICILILGLFITGCQSIALLLNSGQAFVASFTSGLRVPSHAIYGIGFHELGRVLLKFTIVQLPLALLWLLIAAGVSAYTFSISIPMTAFIAVKVAMLAIAVRVMVLIISFSSLSNDTSRFNFPTVAFVTTMIGLVLTMLGLGVASFFVSGWWSIATCSLAIIFSLLFYAAYGFWYNRSGFDLLAAVQQI